VAVRLALPLQTKLHDVVHVGLLKKWVGNPLDAPPPLPAMHNGVVEPEPEHAVHARLARGIRQVLIQWKGEPAASATWEDLDSFRDRFPSFQLEDKLLVEGGRDVMWGRQYSRRLRARDAARGAPEGVHGHQEPEEALGG